MAERKRIKRDITRCMCVCASIRCNGAEMRNGASRRPISGIDFIKFQLSSGSLIVAATKFSRDFFVCRTVMLILCSCEPTATFVSDCNRFSVRWDWCLFRVLLFVCLGIKLDIVLNCSWIFFFFFSKSYSEILFSMFLGTVSEIMRKKVWGVKNC